MSRGVQDTCWAVWVCIKGRWYCDTYTISNVRRHAINKWILQAGWDAVQAWKRQQRAGKIKCVRTTLSAEIVR